MPELTPPPGYRLFQHGDYMRRGDLITKDGGKTWRPPLAVGGPTKWFEGRHWPMARKRDLEYVRPGEEE